MPYKEFQPTAAFHAQLARERLHPATAWHHLCTRRQAGGTAIGGCAAARVPGVARGV